MTTFVAKLLPRDKKSLLRMHRYQLNQPEHSCNFAKKHHIIHIIFNDLHVYTYIKLASHIISS